MVNINPIYLLEDRLFRKVGNFLRDDWRHTKNHLFGFGKGGRYVKKGQDLVSNFHLNSRDPAYSGHVAAAIENPTMSWSNLRKLGKKVDNFVSSEQNWNNSKGELMWELRSKGRAIKNGIDRGMTSAKRKAKKAGKGIAKATKSTAKGTAGAISTGAGLVGLGGIGLYNMTTD